MKSLKFTTAFALFCCFMIHSQSAAAYDYSTCDPSVDPDQCECPTGSTDCYDFTDADLPDFRNLGYSTSWITTETSGPNTDRVTVVFDLNAAPGHGVVMANNDPWGDVDEVTTFIENLTGVNFNGESAVDFDIVQLGKSVQVDSSGAPTGNGSNNWLMNVLTNSSGEFIVDGQTYDASSAPVTIDGIGFPGGSGFFLPSSSSCAQLVTIDSNDNLWEADQCTTVGNDSLSSFFGENVHFTNSRVENLTKNGLSSTLEVADSETGIGFRLTRVTAQLEESTLETIDRDGSSSLVIEEKGSASGVTDYIAVINSQVEFERDQDVYEWVRGECGRGELKVVGDGAEDEDLTSAGWFDGSGNFCPTSTGTH